MPPELDLFAEALEQPPAERAAWLDRVCAHDPILRERVAHLLASHEAAQSFLDSPAVNRPTPLPRLEPQPGEVIGHYTLQRKIGEGGGGVVFLAEQSAPVRRFVALKIIKLGMATADVIKRFEGERQALARMEHADIARVFDAGVTDAGQPFFVMEFVDGQPITRFCDEHDLSLPARLELFRRICLAVQHAHQKGVIHRDLKPSNILVSLQAGEPVPKIIDFGIAKATEGRLTDATVMTAFEQFIGTPAYMSPEQAAARSVDIDTRSDIYSLGVLLYELLTGRTPFDSSTLLRAGLDQMRRHIREVEPPRPSSRLVTLESQTLATTAGHRRLEPPALISRLQGDLDWIVMRCLEKDRGRRYDSATELAKDLHRHLHHEPIEARPASTWYRFERLVRRNRLAFAASAAVLVAILAGSAISLLQARRASRAEARARAEAAVSQAVNAFLTTDLLGQVDAYGQFRNNGSFEPDLKVREALDRASAKVGTRFADQPETEAAVRMAIGQAYLALSLFPAAEPHLQRALELRTAQLGPDHPDTITSQLRCAEMQLRQSHLPAAEAGFRAVLAAQTRLLGRDDRALDETRNYLTQVLQSQGNYAAAEVEIQEILSRRPDVRTRDDTQTLSAINNLEVNYGSQGRYAEAEEIGRRGIALSKKVLGPDHPDTLNAMNNLATTFESDGKFAESAALHEEALAALQHVLGPEHYITVSSMLNLSLTYKKLDRLDEAEDLQSRALEIARRTLGPEHEITIIATNNLAASYAAHGKLPQAITLRESLLDISTRTLGAEHPNTLSILANLGRNYSQVERYPEAAATIERALTGLRQALGPEHPTTLIIEGNLAGVYGHLDRWTDAAKIWRWKLDLQVKTLPPEHPQRLLTTLELAGAYDHLQDPGQSIPLWREALAVRRSQLGDTDGKTAYALAHLAAAQLAHHDLTDAETSFRELIALNEREAPSAWHTQVTRSGLGATLTEQARYAEAEPLLLAAYEAMQATAGPLSADQNADRTTTLTRLVTLYTAWARPTEAATWQNRLTAASAAP